MRNGLIELRNELNLVYVLNRAVKQDSDSKIVELIARHYNAYNLEDFKLLDINHLNNNALDLTSQALKERDNYIYEVINDCYDLNNTLDTSLFYYCKKLIENVRDDMDLNTSSIWFLHPTEFYKENMLVEGDVIPNSDEVEFLINYLKESINFITNNEINEITLRRLDIVIIVCDFLMFNNDRVEIKLNEDKTYD